jgi:hypothetical protein
VSETRINDPEPHDRSEQLDAVIPAVYCHTCFVKIMRSPEETQEHWDWRVREFKRDHRGGTDQ